MTTTHPLDDKPMLCCECLKTYAAPEATGACCELHPDEPLLDLRDPEVILFLEEDDRRRYRKHLSKYLLVSAVPAIAIFALAPDADVFYVLIPTAVLAGTWLGTKTFDWKFKPWTGHSLSARDAMAPMMANLHEYDDRHNDLL